MTVAHGWVGHLLEPEAGGGIAETDPSPVRRQGRSVGGHSVTSGTERNESRHRRQVTVVSWPRWNDTVSPSGNFAARCFAHHLPSGHHHPRPVRRRTSGGAMPLPTGGEAPRGTRQQSSNPGRFTVWSCAFGVRGRYSFVKGQ